MSYCRLIQRPIRQQNPAGNDPQPMSLLEKIVESPTESNEVTATTTPNLDAKLEYLRGMPQDGLSTQMRVNPTKVSGVL